MNLRKKELFHSIDEFIFAPETKPLGRGSFGTVRLATHRTTLRKYAIKIVELNQQFGEYESQLLQREVQIHSSCQHPHIVKLWDVIETQHHIYLVMDYIPKGSLFHFQRKRTLSQGEVYRIYSQIIQSLRHLHSHDIFHRDIKPQNILIDSDMNSYLCDFGWATTELHKKRKTFCGTHQYMSPQMIARKQYDYKIDIWAMGILLFQLSHGAAPFTASSIDEMQHKIHKGSYHIAQTLSDSLKDLIIRILQFEPDDRPTLNDIVQHPWMKVQRETCLKDCTPMDAQASLSVSLQRNKLCSMRKRKRSRNDSNFKNKLQWGLQKGSPHNTSGHTEQSTCRSPPVCTDRKKKTRIGAIEDRLLKRTSGEIGDKENKGKKSLIERSNKESANFKKQTESTTSLKRFIKIKKA